MNLSSIGTPSVKQKAHQTNTLFIYYRTGLLEKAMLAGTVLSWLVVLYHLAIALVISNWWHKYLRNTKSKERNYISTLWRSDNAGSKQINEEEIDVIR